MSAGSLMLSSSMVEWLRVIVIGILMGSWMLAMAHGSKSDYSKLEKHVLFALGNVFGLAAVWLLRNWR